MTLSLGKVEKSSASKIMGHTHLCMHDLLKLRHNCDAYMAVQKE